ncbi:GTP-binding protein GEM [Planococcus citri]|uniref:GTP-binding protein GEM n=1 Tax=Planococcus citri TaxID=170843 RepID=UPI0031F97DCF
MTDVNFDADADTVVVTEDELIIATKIKGRSASVCFSSSARSDRIAECAFPTTSITPPPTPPAVGGSSVKYFRRPASRSQSARLTGGSKSLRRRPPQSQTATAEDGHRRHPHTHTHMRAGVSDPKIYGHTDSETCSPSSPGTLWRESCIRRVNSHKQRKSATFLDIPKTQSSTSASQIADDNSYRLRSFSFTTKGLVNRGDSFRKRHGRSNSIFPNNEPSLTAKHKHKQQTSNDPSSVSPEAVAADSSSVLTYNVSVMGAAGVGKTSLVSQFMTSEGINPYDRDRDEPSLQTISIMLNGEESELCFHEWRHSKIVEKKYAVADAFLILYSVVDKSTFQYAESELSKLHDLNVLLNKPAILVGNKIDLARSRTVSSQDGKCLACTFRVKYVEISVGINHNVDELLVGILNQIRLKKQHCEQQQNVSSNHRWYKNRAVVRASMKARQMFTWIFGREDSKFKNCENLHIL